MDETELKIALAILSAFSLTLVTFIKIQSDKIRDIKAKLSDKKYSTYHEILTILFDLINQTKGLKTVSEDEVLKRVMDVKRDLILYGNDKIIKKFFEWEDNQLKQGYRLWNWAELAAIARKDMGNRWTRISADDILRSLFNDKTEYIEFKNEFILRKKPK
ncbi:hypothetical protein [Algoriphagus boritolerans]|uniref:Uncharacterized protein n=1 Tax=Algoriphagus boritolerans DSM 17298 = JCM 18970 TaxID=1120964 RepID=A0A1H5XDI8_9BACT|nr:hypothetical protein [Algoriphagus boritolerans]SEG09266.1 hypothetical protein SAMN03080598_02443 [Algoriphagus boritolerans DSM 17298 = JCM 18970]